MNTHRIFTPLAVAALLVSVGQAQADVVYANTSWFTIPGENTGGGNSTITSTAAYDGNGSLEMKGDRTRYGNGNYYDTSGNGLYNLNTVSGLTFAWNVASNSSNPYNADYTPALRLHIYDPATHKRSELIWEGAYNGVYGNEVKDTWYQTGIGDNFYQNVSGMGVTLNNGSQVNQTVSDWESLYSAGAVVTSLSVGVGSGASANYHAFADEVTVSFKNATSTNYNFEVQSASVPEPTSLALVAASLFSLGALRRRNKR